MTAAADITRLADEVLNLHAPGNPTPDDYARRKRIAAELRTIALQQGKAGGVPDALPLPHQDHEPYAERMTYVNGWNACREAMIATPPAHSPDAGVTDEMVERVARAVWNIRRDEEDRCDMELEDLGRDHSVWAEARAAIAALAPQPKDAER